MNDKFIVAGGKNIQGEIPVYGAKNFALKILAATLLTEETSIIRNIPQIKDVAVILELLEEMGVKIKFIGKREVSVDPGKIKMDKLKLEAANKVRASIVFAGPLLGRFGKLSITHPGGDLIGKRPIDFFIDSFLKMGVKTKKDKATYILTSKQKLQGASIFFPEITVTGTETLVMAAVLAQGETVIENAAQEPEVTLLCEDLVKMGAEIKGIRTSRLIIEGVEKLQGGDFTVMPDRIEAGTFIMMAVMNNAEIKVDECEPQHLKALFERLEKTGAHLEIGENYVRNLPLKKRIRAVSLKTHEYPGFATDLQPIYTLLMTQAKGLSLIHDSIFEGRLFFTDFLNRMGANIIMCDPHRVAVKGPTPLVGRNIESPDIRAGITLLLAGTIAQGKTIIDNANIIDRGYEKIEERLSRIGVAIKREQGN